MYQDTNELFMLGLQSMMDALLNIRMLDALKEIPVDEEIKKWLLDKHSRCGPILEVVLDYESGTSEQLSTSARRIGLHEGYLPDLWLQSVRWVTEALAVDPALV